MLVRPVLPVFLLLATTCAAGQPPAPGLKVPPGFVASEYAGPELANDILCMTVDAKGRIVVAGRGYIRILVDDAGIGRANRAVEFASEPKGGAMGLLWEGGTLYVTGDGGLRRLVDKDGNGKADGPSQLIRSMKTGGEHTSHAIRRGPDGWLYVLCGNNADIDRTYATLPTSPVKEPIAGCILRFTPDLKHAEIVAHGFRNPYGMDFNADGELFTFDSDIRVLQIALGGIGAAWARGAIWEGYTRRGPALQKSTLDRARKLVRKAIAGVPKGDFQREVLRTAALLEMDIVVVRPLLWRDDAHEPAVLIHDLACLARLSGKRAAADTARAAAAVLSLDRLANEGKHNRDSNWPLRVAELYAGLAEKDANLHAVVLGHAEFGRPDHVLFTQANGFLRAKAAVLFLDKIANDPDYSLTPALVALLGELPAAKALPVLRPRVATAGVESALVPLLAKLPQAGDRPRFIAGLASNQMGVVQACLAALERLPGSEDGTESLALIRALGTVPEKQKNLRAAVVGRLAKITGQHLGSDKEAWTGWFVKAHPGLAPRLANPDGVDVAAWARRLARLEWDKGSAALGQKTFTKASCVHCHSGTQAVGPDLAGVAGRFARADLVTAILQPSRDVPARYQTTVVETAAGKIYQGLVIYDAVDSLILQTGPAATIRLPGGAVVSRRVSPRSLMPAGLLDPLSDREIVDLYAYLKTLGTKTKK